MLHFLKKFLISKSQNNQLTKLIASYITSFYQRLLLLLIKVSTSYLYHVRSSDFPSRIHVYEKKKPMYEALKSKAVCADYMSH